MVTYTATATAGDAIVWVGTSTDPWELQQDVVDFISRDLTDWYTGRDWTGRSQVEATALDQAFRLGEGTNQVGPLPSGTVVQLKEEAQ